MGRPHYRLRLDADVKSNNVAMERKTLLLRVNNCGSMNGGGIDENLDILMVVILSRDIVQETNNAI